MNRKNSFSSRRRYALALVIATSGLALTACGGADDIRTEGTTTAAVPGDQSSAGSEKKGTGPDKLLWMGDSIGEAQAPALGAALKAGGVEFKSVAAAGGGGVIGEMAAPTWESLPKELASFKPDVVAYQITTFDWGTPQEQRTAYERLAKTVNDAGAELVMVSAPPFKVDDFYKPHAAAIGTAPKSAKSVADQRPDSVHFLDAAPLWGTDSAAAKAQRSKDGIHSCQQGSAAFAQWFGKELNALYSYAPAAADQWATGAWTAEKVYGKFGCS
ncbi:SGNH/GDSL hydrolase family protein [Streptomyces sp. NPDC047315]|uniref:SGNH/GDSL hydrolase family protein n=1 Tax=Streptomyces sp. NPDC047315 TaxID=3155142 RepID=UPI0033E1CF2F